MADLAGMPFVDARFDKYGQSLHAFALQAGLTDLFVFSHGWNNNDAQARDLYQRFCTSFAAVAPLVDLGPRKVGMIGVFWPSKQFDELVATASAGNAEGA